MAQHRLRRPGGASGCLSLAADDTSTDASTHVGCIEPRVALRCNTAAYWGSLEGLTVLLQLQSHAHTTVAFARLSRPWSADRGRAGPGCAYDCQQGVRRGGCLQEVNSNSFGDRQGISWGQAGDQLGGEGEGQGRLAQSQAGWLLVRPRRKWLLLQRVTRCLDSNWVTRGPSSATALALYTQAP